jgi:hypothetical protein
MLRGWTREARMELGQKGGYGSWRGNWAVDRSCVEQVHFCARRGITQSESFPFNKGPPTIYV